MAAAAAVGITVLASPAHANTCPQVLATAGIAGAAYVDVRNDGDVWIYQETNGTPGLQRGGSGGVTGLSAEDPCTEATTPDTIVF